MADGSAFYERSSPALLAKQPANPSPPQPVASWGQLRGHLEARMVMLRNWRLSFWEHWALLAEYILPRRYHWLINPNSMTRGLPISQNIIDPTASHAMRICASGMMSGLTSPSRPWFKLRAGSRNFVPDHAATLWFDEVESRVYHVLSHSNAYDSLAQMFEDLVVFGTSPVLIYEDEEDTIRCYNPCAGEYFLAVGSTLRVQTFMRQFNMTVAQIVDMFGAENCPSDVQQMWQSKQANLEVERIVAHAIEPNFPISERGSSGQIDVLKGNWAFRESYWIWGTSSPAPLSMKGFNEAPFIAPRWATTSNDAYGRSPGMDNLPDVMQLQVETKRKAEAIEKQVRPPLLASVELKNEPSSILPGHITYVSNLTANSGMRPIYTVQPELQYMTADLREIQGRIQRGFFNDMFLMIANQAAVDRTTAYEIASKNQEKLQVLGPVIERLQNEALSPFLKRVIGIMGRKGLLPPMPPSLQTVPVEIEYISMLSIAQRAAASAGMDRFLQISGSIGAVRPEALDVINDDEFMYTYADLMVIPGKVLNSREDVAKMRKAKAAAAAQAQQAQMMGQAVQGAVDGAKTLSDTEVGGGINALQLMLQGSGIQ